MIPQNWNEQTIAITGSASGLGKALAVHFTTLGSRVIGIDLDQPELRKLQSNLSTRFVPTLCDVTRWENVQQVFSSYPIVDVLINCAGITGKTNIPSQETDPVNVDLVFKINFFGSYHTAKALLPKMAQRGYGRVLHIASIAGKEGNAGMLAYSASKAAVIGMTKVQGKEMAQTGVIINALAPGVIRTPLVDAMPEKQVQYMTDKIPLKRCANLEEVIPLVEYVVSPSCSFTTGFTFDLSGGRATY